MKRLTKYLGPLISIVLFCAALWVLHYELKQYHYQGVMASLEQISRSHLLLALAITVVNYIVLTGYDSLAFRYIQHRLEYRKIAFTSFIGYAFSNNIGLSMLAGSSVRYRLYSAWGLTAFDIAKVVAFYTITLWLGLFSLAGLVFLLEPVSIPAWIHLPFSSLRPVGFLLLLCLLIYFLASTFRHKPITVRGWEFSFPSPGMSALQVAVSSLDWALGGAVLYVLLPSPGNLSFPFFLGIYLLGQLAGLVSQVPGGLGVFESVALVGLSYYFPAHHILGSLLAFRLIYYLLPLGTAAVLLSLYEFAGKRSGLLRFVCAFGEWIPDLVPRVFALMVFIGGVILLFSGATPEVGWRLAFLREILPLPVIEFSHFFGSLAGVCLLFLARGLQLRLDAAYALTAFMLLAGILASLLKGLDYEEAAILGVMLLVLLPSRKYFYRKASLLEEWFTLRWAVRIALVFVASFWLIAFSYKHLEIKDQMWWSFTFSGNAPRSLRATVGAAVVCLLFGLARLFKPASPRGTQTSKAMEQETVRLIVALSPSTMANLALLGDKLFLFSKSMRSFIMYGIEGRSRVAMGDPVGPKEEWSELVWSFYERCDRHGTWPVFYQVGLEGLPLYIDLGLSVLKLGEEARVHLHGFSLEGKERKNFRNVRNRFEKEGFSFTIFGKSKVPGILPQLEEISNAWLREKNTREKRFSLGSFSPEYMGCFPCAVIKKGDSILAFANLWLGAEKEELSVDLMRYLPDSPADIMEYLFIRLMLWGKDQGYHWFNLGMAPLSGLEYRTLAPAWSRVGALIFQHGEHFYNFQGLRRYKEKFDPVWEPKYLACPDGLTVPRVLANIASLVSGGVRGVLAK